MGFDGRHRGRASGLRQLPVGRRVPAAVGRRARDPRRRRSRPARHLRVPHGSRRRRLHLLGARPPNVHRRRCLAPGGVFRREGCPGARLQGRPRPLPRMDRPHRPPPGGRGHRLRRTGLPRVRVGGDAALRSRRHRGRACGVRTGRQDRRPLRAPRTRHPRADRRRSDADLPGRDRRGDGAARRGHGIDRSSRVITNRDR